jgi:hypothetical protein
VCETITSIFQYSSDCNYIQNLLEANRRLSHHRDGAAANGTRQKLCKNFLLGF